MAIIALAFGGLCLWSASGLLKGLYWLCWASFMSNALLRLAACIIRPAKEAPLDPMTEAVNENLPSYSVIIALYKEASIVPQLLRAMRALDYPRDRLEILFALEADDTETLTAFQRHPLPAFMRVIAVPQGFPRTKPRALNHALEQARGDLIVIYDAEDQPHPAQLREAAKVFAKGDTTLACLQAPLRPIGGSSFIARQFAAEYAVQFDVLLPALHALHLPFPLGGTSNHFKSDILRAIGGWDAFNVTEDADLGLRLAQLGYKTGMITSPTLETPPSLSQAWIPQRTRWIKGYMQTFLVHTRLNTPFQPRAWLGLFLGVALSVAAAVCYAPFSLLVITSLLLTGLQTIGDAAHPLHIVSIHDLALFFLGTLSGMITIALAARRAGLRLKWGDVLGAPAYWCLQSVAAGFAVWQLIAKPFHWDKTEHTPVTFAVQPLYEDGPYAYGLEHDHYRQPNHLAHQSLG
ncbi:glycosyltransferase [Asticcacaulis sp.]|uniref:glycosyltransferase n=1 Tax=Asticcacaulis sp. TaxID=1872648 RepID=UPI002BB29093|nr:glycosyltransferase [Asticcacaulis sp.]HTM79490.1 glycosyltransferase [Asticcacaulis sp.]